MKIIPLTIEKYAPPGNGLGFYQDKAVFVPRAVVGDELQVRVEKEKRRYILGSLVEIVKAGPKRRPVPCVHYDVCGGCDLLQLAYPDQLRLKEEMLIQTLAGAGIDQPAAVVPAASENYYRHRAIFHCDKQGQIGFLRRRSHQVVPVPECLVLAPGLKKLLRNLNENQALPAGVDSFYALANRAGDLAVMGCKGRFRPENLKCLKGMAKTVSENYGFGDLELAAAGFAQVNPPVVSLIIEDLLEHCADTEMAAELYGGSGTFSVPLARITRRLTVYESDKQAVARGRRNAERNRLDNIRFVSGRAEKINFSEPLDMIVVDPPRTGLHPEVINKIIQSSAAKLVYVSCNPATLARDLARLQASTGKFKPTSIKAYDMYPGTTHLEVMAVLAR